MQTVLAYLRMFAPMCQAVAVSLTPFYGKDAWYLAVVAAAGAINLISPSILPSGKGGTTQ